MKMLCSLILALLSSHALAQNVELTPMDYEDHTAAITLPSSPAENIVRFYVDEYEVEFMLPIIKPSETVDVNVTPTDDQSADHVKTAALLPSAASDVEQVSVSRRIDWPLEEETGFDCE